MANRSFEMYQYRQVLPRIRQGDTDRAIGRVGLMGRAKAADPAPAGIGRAQLTYSRQPVS